MRQLGVEPRHMRRQEKNKKVSELGYYRSLLTSAGEQMCHLAPATISNHMNFTTALISPSQIASLSYTVAQRLCLSLR